MKPEQIDEILARTLDDFHLSRGEKKLVGDLIKETGANGHDLAFLRHRAFEMAREQLLGPDARKVVDWLEEISKVFQPEAAKPTVESRAYFSPRDDCPRAIAGLFAKARRGVDVCVFTITDDRIARAILSAHGRGVKIRIITDNDKSLDRGSDVCRLKEAGVAMRVDQSDYHMHHKFAVYDRKKLLTGSYNWTRSAAQHNEENFILTEERGLLKRFTSAFDELWESLE